MWPSPPPLLRIILPSAAAAATAAAAAISLPSLPLSHADAATTTTAAASVDDALSSSSADLQDESIVVTNWSATHEVCVPSSRYFQPESLSQIQSIVDTAQSRGLSLRPSGSALSPNGLGLCEHGMLSLALYDGTKCSVKMMMMSTYLLTEISKSEEGRADGRVDNLSIGEVGKKLYIHWYLGETAEIDLSQSLAKESTARNEI